MTVGSKIYSNAVAKYDEGKLLDAEKLKRITEASYSDAIKMLYDYGYGEGLAPENADAEKLTATETRKLIDFIKEYAPSDAIAEILLIEYKYNDVKAAYKSRFTAVGETAYYGGFDFVTDAVKSGEYNSLSEILGAALTELDGTGEENPKSSEIDVKLTAAMYAEMLKYARKAGGLIKNYVKKKIDFTNMATAYRAKRAGADETVLKSMLIGGGALTAETVLSIFRLEPDEALKVFDGEYYEQARILLGGDVTVFDKQVDEILYRAPVRNRENMTSADPFVGYVLAKEAEIKTVKLVLTCLKNGATGEIARRLRNFYD